MHEIHSPDMVGMCWRGAVSPQLRLDTSLRNLVTKLEVHALVKTVDSLWVHGPPVTPDQDMHTTIAIAHARLTDILDLQLQFGLIAASGLVDVKGPVDLQDGACASDRNLPVRFDCVDKIALAVRPQSFFDKTS